MLNDITQRLELKGKPFQIQEGCSENQVESFWKILQEVEPALTPADTLWEKIKDMGSLQAFYSHCCQMRHYAFCIKKCGKDDCGMCKPVRMKKENFEKLRFLPDPLMQDDGHYLPFDKAFTSDTTEKDRPSLKRKSVAKPLPFSPSVQHAKNTDTMVQCEECDSWRLVFSKKKLPNTARSTLQSILEDVSYTCGSSFEDLDLPDSLASIVIRDHRCEDPIERLCYSAGYEYICIFCATASDLLESLPESTYPICSTCSATK